MDVAVVVPLASFYVEVEAMLAQSVSTLLAKCFVEKTGKVITRVNGWKYFRFESVITICCSSLLEDSFSVKLTFSCSDALCFACLHKSENS